MAKNSITDYSKTASLNTDIQSVDIDEGCLPSGINNAIRELMADLAAMNDGTVSLTSPAFTSVDINGGTIDGAVIGGASAAAGTFTTGQFNTSLNVDGTVTADGVELSGTSVNLTLFETDQTDLNTRFRQTAGDIYIQTIVDDSSSAKSRLGIDHATGDISFYEDTGTTAKLFWDASAERLGIGTSSPSEKLQVQGSGTTRITVGNSTVNTTGQTTGIDFEPISNLTNSAKINVVNGLSPTTASAYTAGFQFVTEDYNGSSFSQKTALTIGASGNVGIGTDSPASLVTGGSSPVLTIGGTDTALVTGDKSGAISFITNDGSYTGTYSDGITGEIASVSDSAVGGAYGLAFYTGTTTGSNRGERMRIDSSGNVTLGAGGTYRLDINAPTSSAAKITCDNTSMEIGTFDNHVVKFLQNNTERMRIDSSGNVLVRTTTSPSGIGVKLSNGGSVGDGRSGVYFGLNGVYPSVDLALSDNDRDLGAAIYRWDDVYATNGTIQTSDQNEKQDIEALSEAEQRVAVAAKGLLRKFRWIDSVEEKGDDARIHFGIIAQDLQAAFEAEGLDAGRYAMFINSTWTDEETGEERSRMGVRYNQLLAFIIAAI